MSDVKPDTPQQSETLLGDDPFKGAVPGKKPTMSAGGQAA